MRTTINIPDEAFSVIESLATSRGISLGAAVAELVAKALKVEAPRNHHGFPIFSVAQNAPVMTLAQTLAAEDDE
jgi:hypothetical protein